MQWAFLILDYWLSIVLHNKLVMIAVYCTVMCGKVRGWVEKYGNEWKSMVMGVKKYGDKWKGMVMGGKVWYLLVPIIDCQVI